MASLHSTLTDAGEPGPPHVVRFRWKPELDGELRAGRETFKRIDTARRWLRDFEEARETGRLAGRARVRARMARARRRAGRGARGADARRVHGGLAAPRRGAQPRAEHDRAPTCRPTTTTSARCRSTRRIPTGRCSASCRCSEFAEPHIHNEFRESLRLTGRSKSNQDAAKKVLSSALSWGVESRAYRRWLPTNGAKLVTGRRRRSNRARADTSADVRLPRSRVFNAFDYELVRAAAARAHRPAHLGAAPRRRDARPAVRLRLPSRGGARRALVAGALAHREVARRAARARGCRRRPDRRRARPSARCATRSCPA